MKKPPNDEAISAGVLPVSAPGTDLRFTTATAFPGDIKEPIAFPVIARNLDVWDLGFRAGVNAARAFVTMKSQSEETVLRLLDALIEGKLVGLTESGGIVIADRPEGVQTAVAPMIATVAVLSKERQARERERKAEERANERRATESSQES